MKETDGIADYNAKFELIRARLSMSEEYLLSAYLAGLRLDTQMHIRMFSPQSTRQCLVLGRLYEKAHPKKAVSNSWNGNKSALTQSNAKGILQWKKDGNNKNNKEGERPKGGNQ